MIVDIKPIDASFAKYSWHLRNDTELWRYMKCDSPLPATLESEATYYNAKAKDPNNMIFAILATNVFVGFIALKNIAYGAAELSYCILRRDYWGKGIVSKATLLALKYAYEFLKLDLVYLYINPLNQASYKNAINKHFIPVGKSFITPGVERLEMTKTGWEKVLK